MSDLVKDPADAGQQPVVSLKIPNLGTINPNINNSIDNTANQTIDYAGYLDARVAETLVTSKH